MFPLRTRSRLTASTTSSHYFPILYILLLSSSLAAADVEFTVPAAGASVPVGTIDVAWQDSGTSPSLQDLTQYTLDLMVGGNDAGQMLPLTTFVSQGDFGVEGEDDSAKGTIAAGIAGSVDNGFFFRMTSTVATGGTIVNYSSRFSIANLTGSTAVQYRQAAEALDGSTAGPATEGNGLVPGSTSSSASSTSTPSTTLTSSIVATATTTSTPVTSSTSTPTPGSATTTDPLSLAAKIGIIAAIAVAFLLFSSIGLYFLLRRHRRLRAGIIPLGTNPFLDDKAELPAQEHELKPQSAHSNRSELYAGSEVFEADDGARRPELDHMTFRAELPG